MDDLSLAHSFQAARQAVSVAGAASGAHPSTIASRVGLAVEPGQIVRDTVTGLYGVVSYATVQDVIRAPAR